MEIYDAVQFIDITDDEFRGHSFKYGSLSTLQDVKNLFLLVPSDRQRIFFCSSISSSNDPQIISTFSFKSSKGSIQDARICMIEDMNFALLLVDENVSSGSSVQRNRTLWIMDPSTGRTWKTNYQIPQGSIIFQVAATSNSNGSCQFVLGSGNQFYIGAIGLSSISRSGAISFAYSQLDFVNLSSLNSKKITSLNVYQSPNQDYCFVFAGTDSGIVEVWRYNNGQVKFMCKLSCDGIVSQIDYQPEIPTIRNEGVIFVSHKSQGRSRQSTPLDVISVFHIDAKFTMASKDEDVSWSRDNGEQLVSFRSVPESSGFNVACVYKHSDNSFSFDVYSLVTDSNSKVHQVSIAEPILDIIPHCGSLGNVTLLTTERLVRFVHTERVPYDSFDELYSPKPAFDKWFTRDSSTFLYKTPKSAMITSMRLKLGGELFFDKLLSLNGIEKSRYPPAHPHEFETLFNAILNNANQGMTLKHCLVYYFLKDASIVKAEKYAEFYGITRPFLLAIDGFWAMDNGLFTEAIQYLADPCVDLDDSAETCLEWPKKILTSLYENGEYALASVFIKSTSPSVWSPSSISIVLHVLAKTNLLECLQFCRLFCKHDLESSLSIIFTEFLTDLTPQRSTALLSAPLSKEEESFLVKYCKDAVQTSIHDFLLNFLIQRGRKAEALQAYQELFVSRGKENATRQNLMKNVALLLPRIQRLALGLSVPAYVAPSADQGQVLEMLSQSKAVRAGPRTEHTILEALQQNYLTEPTTDLNQEQGIPDTESQMQVDSEPLVSIAATPVKFAKSLEGSPIVKSPFVQQPFTSHRKSENSPQVAPSVSGRVSLGRKSIGDFSTVGTPGSLKSGHASTPQSLASRKMSENPSPLNSNTKNTASLPSKPETPAFKRTEIQGKVSSTPIQLPSSSRGTQNETSTSKSNAATATMNLPPTPLVASAPPLVNRSPFTSKPFIPARPVLEVKSAPVRITEVAQEPEDDAMDEDAPPQSSFSFVNSASVGVDAETDEISKSASSSTQTSPERTKDAVAKKRSARSTTRRRTSPRKKEANQSTSNVSISSKLPAAAIKAEQPQRFSSVTSPGTSLASEPRKLRSTRRKGDDISLMAEPDVPSSVSKTTARKTGTRSTRKPAESTEPIVKTHAPRQKSEETAKSTAQRGTRSLRPRK